MPSTCQKAFKAILLTLVLTGCWSSKKPVEENPAIVAIESLDRSSVKTDAYIDSVEAEVSKAVSGIKAATDGVDIPLVNKLALEAQIERLSGISKATVHDLEAYQKAIKDGDETYFIRDKADAASVDEKTTLKWKEVEKAKKELAAANSRAELAEKALKDLQAKETMEAIRKYFLAGGAVFTLLGGGALMAAMWFGLSGLKKAGAVGLAIGTSLMALPIFLPTILMQAWFSYTAGGIILLTFGYTAWSFRRRDTVLTPPENT